MELQRQVERVTIRRPGGSKQLEIRIEKPVLKHLNQKDLLPHNDRCFAEFERIFWKRMKPLLDDFADGTIVNKLNKDCYESLASLERSCRPGLKIMFSDCGQTRHIRMGNIVEETWCDFIKFLVIELTQEKFSNEEIFKLYKAISNQSGKDLRLDDYFKYKSTPFVAEYKLNLNLDTEKTPAVIDRQKRSELALCEVFGEGVSVIVSLLSPTINELMVKGKYQEIEFAVFGYQELLNLFGINFCSKKYEKLLMDAEKKCKEEFDDYNKYRNFGKTQD